MSTFLPVPHIKLLYWPHLIWLYELEQLRQNISLCFPLTKCNHTGLEFWVNLLETFSIKSVTESEHLSRKPKKPHHTHTWGRVTNKWLCYMFHTFSFTLLNKTSLTVHDGYDASTVGVKGMWEWFEATGGHMC